MKGAQTLRRMCKQAGGIDQPTEKYIDAILQWLETGLLIYDKIGKAGAGSLIEIFEYAYSKYGCDQFIVDSLMRLGLAADDYSGQEKAVFQLLEWTIEKGVHLHLVAHSRKGGSQNGAPDTEDVKGTSEIGSNAANVITVWRNKDLERDVSALSQDDNSEEAREMWRTPGVICNLAKQRSGDFEGQIGLWFDKGTYRYHSFYELSFRDDRPLPKFFGRDYVSRTFRENESDNADSHIPF
jgi:twinkle protein